MRRLHWTLALICAVYAVRPVAVSADGFWHRFQLDRFRNLCWPEPFREQDRHLTQSAFTIMKDNGWRLENTLSDSFFHAESQRLTRAGELKVRWIVTQAPVARRTVYVLRGETPAATTTRLDTVQEYLATLVPEGARPDVLLTDIVPPGGSGEYFDAVDRQFKASVPPPRLPSAGGGGGGAAPASGSAN